MFFVFKADGQIKPENDGYSFTAIASSTNWDKQGERLSEKCLAEMAEESKVPLTVGATHKQTIIDPTAIVGFGAPELLDDHRLLCKCQLIPKHVHAASLAWIVQNAPEELAFSVMGSVPEGAVEKTREGTVINSLVWNHLLLCRSGSNVNEDAILAGLEKAELGEWPAVVFKAALRNYPERELDVSSLGEEMAKASIEQHQIASPFTILQDLQDDYNRGEG